MSRLIINADDFGYSDAVNQGIIKAHREGILTSATIMANMPHFQAAVSLAKQHPDLGVGIHLNVLRGRPLSPPRDIYSLLQRDGLFFNSISTFAAKFFSRQIKPTHILQEYRRQIESVFESGLKPTHLDSEKHQHTLPGIFPLVIELAKLYGIGKVRYVDERPFAMPTARNLFDPKIYKAWLISLFSTLQKKKIRRKNVRHVDAFFGISITGKMYLNAILPFLEKMDGGTYEFMCHPGLPEMPSDADSNAGKFYITRTRPLELEILLSKELKTAIQRKQIRLIHYGDL
ncbi:ChbG/HpnK family deacetylase [candidate division KSB1 bacterium]|nr:ChbG/HpnK family deacetylase [candidate division KSB1 bacterium]